jgi:cell division protease FtsH
MKISPTIELILNLAAREAIASQFGEIQSEHLFAGILKFSELEIKAVENLFTGFGALECLKKELSDVRAVLRDKKLDSTSLRRKLRKALGNGGVHFKGDVIHRSNETRQVFTEAEKLSRQEQARILTSVHFLRVIFKDPTPMLARVLGMKPQAVVLGDGRGKADGSGQDGFEEHDLVTLAQKGQIKLQESRKTQARTLERHAVHARTKPVLVVGEKEATVRECFETMVCELIARKAPDNEKEQKEWKIVEISVVLPQNEMDHLFQDNTRRIVRNASDNEVDTVIITGLVTEDSIRQGIKVLAAEMAAVEHTPCIMLSVPDGIAKNISGEKETAIPNCHQVWLLANPAVQVPERLEPAVQNFGPTAMNSPFFSTRTVGMERHLLEFARGGEVSVESFLIAAGRLNELGGALAQFLGLSIGALKDAAPEPGMATASHYEVSLSDMAKELLSLSLGLARDEPDNVQPGLIDLRHLAGSMALLPEVCTTFKVPPASREDVTKMLAELFARDLSVMGMGELAHTLKALRTQLVARVFGQDHAIHSFVEGLFNAEVVAAADVERRQPKAIFVFAGPPGVGKTFLAECAARALGQPFQRFDMSGYSDHQVSAHLLAGIQRSYQGAHAGRLTEFVHKHPNCLLLFDEIEKAHLNVIHLFLQILDQGRLQDQFTEQDVLFRDTIIIFTTNAGKQLYNDPNASGVHLANTNFHRKTILNALESERDSRTGKPFFPQAICSRMATGYPLMFNHLGVNELERIAAAEMKRMAGLLERQYYREIEFGPLVPICTVLREGAGTDARTVRSQAETFVKSEMFQLSRLYRPERFDSILEDTDRIVFDLDPMDTVPDEIRALLEPAEKPKILLVADAPLSELWSEHVPSVEWKLANDPADVINLLEAEEIDLVLLDLWLGSVIPGASTFSAGMTMYQFDHVPGAASGIKEGQELLRMIHEKHPEVPCYLLSFGKVDKRGPGMDEELFQACVRSGGARGVIETTFVSAESEDWETGMEDLTSMLDATARRIYRERKARELGAQRKIVSFDTAPKVSVQDRSITVRLRNLHLASAMAADDVSEILQDVERPTIGFPDVYGADAAKAELEYMVNWLKDPRQYRAMGLRPPRGILLYGHPGTGKTMLARALAGECNVTFIVESATNFVTKYVGSGPENIRKLFARARRYAPTILFIDEIDAVGKKRGNSGSRAYDETLNAILTEMDGFDSSAKKPVIVIAATNLIEHLDDALRRRFDREIEVDKPDRAARTAYLKKRLQGKKGREVSDEVIQRLAGQSANMTIADLERIVELAGRMASSAEGVITDALVEEAFERMLMGEAKGETDPETLLRVARHEAGHCLIGWLRGEKPVQITIVARGNAGGFVEREADENRMLYTRAELEGTIRQSMGGRAAEIIYYGEENGLTTGVSGDLQTATHYAEIMVRAYGMGEGIGQVTIDPKRLADGPLAIKVMEAAEKIVKSQLDRAITELQERRESMDQLVDKLMEKNRLTRSELEAILG